MCNPKRLGMYHHSHNVYVPTPTPHFQCVQNQCELKVPKRYNLTPDFKFQKIPVHGLQIYIYFLGIVCFYFKQ